MILRFIFAFLIFFLIVGGIHFYIYFRLNHFFKFAQLKWIIISLGILLPAGFIGSRMSHNYLTIILNWFSSIWMGIMFFLLSTLLIYEIIRLFVKLSPITWGIIVLSIVAAVSLVAIINGQFIVTNELTIELENINKPLKIVQLSDIHFGVIHNSNFLEKIVKKTNAQNPDLVLITGDLFDSVKVAQKKGVPELKLLNAKTFFVSGNHDLYENISVIKKLLSENDVQFLSDELVEYK